MSVTVNHSVTADLAHSATLSDLEEFVAAAKAAGMGSSARLDVQKHTGNQREPDYATITVRQR